MATCKGSGRGICFEVKRQIPADLDGVEKFTLLVREALAKTCGHADAFAAELVCREALVNAVRHGCRFDAAKTLSVAIRLRRDRVTLWVRDDGPGFDWRSRLKHVAELDDLSGRGLSIYQACADRVRFRGHGNEVVLVKHFSKGETNE